MKRLASLAFLVLLLSCSEQQPEAQEVKATITSFGIAVAACMGGYTIETEAGMYKINSLPPESPYNQYDKISYPAAVWIRYKKTTEGQCLSFGPLIDITTIRAR